MFARPEEPDGPEGDSGDWDVEWHALDGLDDHGELAKIEEVVAEGTGDPAQAREWIEAIESVMGEEDDDEAELDPDDAMTALRDALAALGATGATTATVRYSVEDFGRAFADALDAASAEIETGSQEPADVAASVTGAVEALFDRSPWQLDALELDGRGVTDGDAEATPLREAGMLVLLARLGDWDELWSMSGSSGVLEIDLRGATAAIAHRHPTWRSLPAERVILRPRDHG